MSISAKITSLTNPNRITIAQDGYTTLPSQMKPNLKKLNMVLNIGNMLIERKYKFTNFMHSKIYCNTISYIQKLN
jgi:hypothetical protein